VQGMKKLKHYQKKLKRIIDIAGSLSGMALLWPIALLIGFLVKTSSCGPVIYSQNRIGIHGIPFKCYKFRTMYTGADKYGNVTTGVDKRVTSVGRILRKYKLDELPQLWNVFIGKMSFVGPRPDVSGYADMLQGENRIILDLLPGITGPASLCFRNEEDLLSNARNPQDYNDSVIWPAKVKINMEYAVNWSFWKDIGYIIVTLIPVVDKILRIVPLQIVK
jgi:lipopolysaccharide/colanic/teichoic acid biosynthesis glycosyltransferase